MIITVPKNMLRCNCEERPRCQMYSCDEYADGFALVPVWDRKQPDRATSKFTCIACWKYYAENWAKPIPGFTRPDWWPKDEPWKPQITDMIVQAEIARKDRERKEREKADGRVIRELSPRPRR